MQNENEKGNALFLILIAVVLFAALSYAITQSNRGGSGAGKETASLSASSIMSYMSSIKMGFTRLQLRGFGANGAWYENSAHLAGPRHAAYNTNADLIKGNIFHPDGGGVAYMDASIDWVNEVDKTSDVGNLQYVVKKINGVGADNQEAIVILKDVKEAVCKRLNFMLTGSETIPTLARAEAAFLIGGNAVDNMGSVTDGQHAYCIKTNDSDKFFYYSVLGEDAGDVSPW